MFNRIASIEKRVTEKQIKFYGLVFLVASALCAAVWTIFTHSATAERTSAELASEESSKPNDEQDAEGDCSVSGSAVIESDGDGTINVICGEINEAEIVGN